MSNFPELEAAMRAVEELYRERGIFQGRFGFGESPAIVVIDFAYRWTDDAYAIGSQRLDQPVENTAKLLQAGRAKSIPVIYTTSPDRSTSGPQPRDKQDDPNKGFRPVDTHAVEIDERLKPQQEDLIIEKDNASAFFGTHLASHLIEHRIDTLLITGCSTSACVRATATDAKSYRFRPIIVSDCVGDRAEAAHIFTLFDIQARFADVVSLQETLDYVEGL